MATIFSRIIAGEIPCYKIAEDQNNFAFLDINPVAPGHVLVVPKKEVDYLFDLNDQDYASLQMFAKQVATAVKAAMPCVRVGVAVMGLEVPHAHIHLIPINEEKDMNFFKEKVQLPQEEMVRIAQAIAAQMQQHSEVY
ncbi:MAG: HIT family protein [Muribaculaceae bacterium]|jgi:histidine triad (HIT) family protein|nr:HIT family protein [Muribaculaceae bacterium]MEE0975123.1 HIT family protein [Muribaculaceae bacterium]